MTERSQTLVLATANPGKAAEIIALLGDHFDIRTRPTTIPDVVEDADTLVGNARLKARAITQASGQAALADDTGLEVDALNGAPGVHSARFAGVEDPSAADEANCRHLLSELKRLGANTPSQRRARFRTVLLVMEPDGSELVVEGVVEGVIAPEMRGSNGFGYDSVFIPQPGDNRTFAELAAEEKNEVSHRARALTQLAALLYGKALDNNRTETDG